VLTRRPSVAPALATLPVLEAERLAPLFRLASHTGAIASRRTRVGYTMVDRAGTKTAAGARVVDLDAETVEGLKLWRKAQAAEREGWGPAYVDSGYVFTDESGQPLHADHAANRFDRLVRKASVPTIRFHDLPHTPRSCSRLASRSTSSPSVSATPRRRSRSRSTAMCCPGSSPLPPLRSRGSLTSGPAPSAVSPWTPVDGVRPAWARSEAMTQTSGDRHEAIFLQQFDLAAPVGVLIADDPTVA
jgi:hypothetical protein